MKESARELLLLRHAKSAWDTGASTDYERPLARRGQKAAPKVGRFLAAEGLVPDYVISSPAARARQTALLACAEMGLGEDHVHWDRRIYHAGVRALVGVLRESPDSARRVLIVGHNPGFEQLLEYLSADPVPVPDDWKLMPTAALARLEVMVPWAELGHRQARLLSLTRSRSL
jgi:phosphohistidine phosphatase